MEKGKVKLVECPRDAMQGWKTIIPTQQKAAYINSLLEVGFDTLDFGSFVSSRAIPQMADTKEVIRLLKTGSTATRLLAIVANERGATEACGYTGIACLGYPFSVSETFQQRNTNAGIRESVSRVGAIQNRCAQKGKELVIYLSMGFGNPYGDAYSEEIVYEWANHLAASGIRIISLADTVGLASPALVLKVTKHLVDLLPGVEIGVHLHSTAENWLDKIAAADEAGCHRFDGALKGIGGCPMAGDDLVGNMNTEWMIDYFGKSGRTGPINKQALEKSLVLASEIFV